MDEENCDNCRNMLSSYEVLVGDIFHKTAWKL
jgi:hypothetical protein